MRYITGINRNTLLYFFVGILVLSYTAAIIYLLNDYFITDINIYLGLLLVPYILIIKKGEFSFKYLLPLVVFLVASFFAPVKSVLFLTILFGFLFLIESCIGKLNNSFLILLLLISPIFYYFNNSIGFPIRLWLSEMSGHILSITGKEIKVIGNIMLMDGIEFNVDSACAGLKMIMVSFIIALFILSYYQRKSHSHFSLYTVISFLAVTFILNIICNLIRIIALVYFKIMPENIFHDIIGILCLAIYVIAPLIFISKYKFEKLAVSEPSKPKTIRYFTPKMILNGIILVIICYSGIKINSTVKSTISKNYYIQGFNKEVLSTGVIKFEDDNALIYLKPMKYYSAEHNPMICWRGSGYEFKQINKEFINGHEIFTGILIKDDDLIYTAWWYDSGKYNTISQLDWRWKVMQNDEDFLLVNVSALTKMELINEAVNLINKSSFNNLQNHATIN